MIELPTRLRNWLAQPGCQITSAEVEFLEAVRAFAARGVGYGFMQQIIEWEWQDKGIGAWGPEYFAGRIAALEGK